MELNQLSERRAMEREYERVSPFEFKNKLISLATESQKKSTQVLLNAGRGNPNWIASTPRDAFFTLGHFAVQDCREVWDERDLAGKPKQEGIATRLQVYLEGHREMPGSQLLLDIINYGIVTRGFVADEWVHELVDGIIGDNYPVPDRMLVHVEQVVHDYLMEEMCNAKEVSGKFELFAVEGATAAMCYIFDSMVENYLLTPGDTIALMVPIFPPYIEIPQLARYNFRVVEIKATSMDESGNHTWQYPRSELQKLSDEAIKALFLVNPSNPPSVAMKDESVQQLIEIVHKQNPNLMIISDDVYGTFADDYHSLMADLPFNTIGVYSYSKYFGVTGWRLGVVAIHEENVFDELLKRLPEEKQSLLHQRYQTLSEHPSELKFINRMVADSRQVALNHTAGLSTPQQIQMALFSVFALLDKENNYKQLTKDICHRRMRYLYDGLGLSYPDIPHDADYYTEFDLAEWAAKHYGSGFTDYLRENYEPLDILFRLAEESSIVLLNGGGFHGPTWSIRVSLANLADEAYTKIGQELHKTLEEYVASWRALKS